MIHDFEDFCTYTFVIVDDIVQKLAPMLKRPGPAPDCSDSELIAMTLIGECRGWDVETELLSHMRDHRALFPIIPCQSRFNRRRRTGTSRIRCWNEFARASSPRRAKSILMSPGR